MPSESQSTEGRPEFKKLAELQGKRSTYIRGPIFLLGLAAAFFFPISFVAPITIIALILAGFAVPSLACPVCHKDTESSVASYCPECGAQSLKKPGFLSWSGATICGNCQKDVSRGKGPRRYKIRFCTHCGEHLDSVGV